MSAGQHVKRFLKKLLGFFHGKKNLGGKKEYNRRYAAENALNLAKKDEENRLKGFTRTRAPCRAYKGEIHGYGRQQKYNAQPSKTTPVGRFSKG